MSLLHLLAATIGASMDPVGLTIALILGLASSSVRVGAALGAAGGILAALIYMQLSKDLGLYINGDVVVGTIIAGILITMAVAAAKFWILKKRGE